VRGWAAIVLLLAATGCGRKQDADELLRIGKVIDGGDAGGGETAARTYVQKYPRDAQGWLVLAKALDGQRKESESVEANRKALALNPRAAQAYTNLGIIHRRRKEYDAAMENYRKAVELDPTHAQAYSSMAIIELKRNRDAEALTLARKAVSLDATDATMAANLAVVLHYNGLTPERDQAFETARRLGYRSLPALRDIFDGKSTIRD
jgi:Flp pilus assembly protein TadD